MSEPEPITLVTTKTTNPVGFVSISWYAYQMLQQKDPNTFYIVNEGHGSGYAEGYRIRGIFKGEERLAVDDIIYWGGAEYGRAPEPCAELAGKILFERMGGGFKVCEYRGYVDGYQWRPMEIIPYLNTNGPGEDQSYDGSIVYDQRVRWDGAHGDISPDYQNTASNNALVTEKQVSKFVADQLALISAGVGSVHHEPVADIAALKALVSTEQTDKEIILVEAENSIWRWDAEATTAPTASGAAVTTVVLPTDLEEDYGEDPTTPGRWIKLLNGASLILTSATPASIGFEDTDNDNVYTAKTATAGVSTEVARADHVHELTGVARVDQICWTTIQRSND
jgi:hypothetical protein